MKLEWYSVLLVLLMVVLVGSVRGDHHSDAEEVVVASAEELNGIKAKKITWEKDGAKMVLIPEGFKKTEDSYDEFGDLVPGKLVKVSDPLYMDAFEVTVGQFKKFLKFSGYKPKYGIGQGYDARPINWNKVYEYSPTDKHPMIYVWWVDAVAYAKWASKRLPTEAEWEFAARGGLVDKKFSWGDNEAVSREYANYKEVGGKDKWNAPAPVGSLKPNGYGLYDMSGNLWEWCQGWYDSNSHALRRVLRGGSWDYKSYCLPVAYRHPSPPRSLYYGIGFRCVSGLPAAQQ